MKVSIRKMKEEAKLKIGLSALLPQTSLLEATESFLFCSSACTESSSQRSMKPGSRENSTEYSCADLPLT